MSNIVFNQGLDNEIVIPMSEFIDGLMSSMKRKTPKEELREELLEFKKEIEHNLKELSRMKECVLKSSWKKELKLYGAFVIYVLNRNLKMALYKKEKLELFSHPFLERVLEEEKFFPQELKIDTDDAVDLSNEGAMVMIENHLKTRLDNMKLILEDCEKIGWWPYKCLLIIVLNQIKITEKIR